MYQTTLCFLVKGKPVREVLLGMKKTGFGAGKYNGFGGKVQPGETVEEATIREMIEESGVVVTKDDLEFGGELEFLFPKTPDIDHNVRVYLAKSWEGQPVETDEMKPKWFEISKIPFEQMWQDDIYWLPKVLKGEKVSAKVIFEDDGEGIKEYYETRKNGNNLSVSEE